VEHVDTGKPTAAVSVTALYTEHALGLVRLAVVMLGDQPAAEDVVQEAFLGLYRHWDRLADPAKALSYVRSSVLNGCRTALRRRARRDGMTSRSPGDPPAAPADARILLGEEHAEVLAAVRRLPARQREAVILRFYLDVVVGPSGGWAAPATSTPPPGLA
jgi:RNA polymerase sigma factor (sigma-70 family)